MAMTYQWRDRILTSRPRPSRFRRRLGVFLVMALIFVWLAMDEHVPFSGSPPEVPWAGLRSWHLLDKLRFD
ncbi:MAG: hypothetical protein K0S56_3321 [Microvirga sp.]|nr:hypothetical protein [Microvirga sp.]